MKRMLKAAGALVFIAVALIVCSVFTLDGCGTNRDPSEVASMLVRESLNVPLATFRIHVGRYPSTEEGLAALIQCPPTCEGVWKGPYLEAKAFPLDPWGSPFQYVSPGMHNPKGYDLWSFGPDRIQSDDDIGNWKK